MADAHEPDSPQPRDVFRHYVGDLVYGANDGVITTFAVVSGVAGADLSAAVVLILGFANLLADGFSMGASNYLAIRSSSAAEGRDRGIREPLLHAAATMGAFVVAGFVPLLAYLLPMRDRVFLTSSVMSAVVLFAVGASRSAVTSRTWLRSGLEMLAVGAVAGAVAFGVGRLLARWVGPL